MGNRYLTLEHYETGKASAANGGDGTLYWLVYDNEGVTVKARSNVAVEEFPAGGSVYRVSVPDTWAGVIIWSDEDETVLGTDDFSAEPAGGGGFNGVSQLTLRFLDADGVPIPTVTFVIDGIGTAVTSTDGAATVNVVDGTYSVSAIAKDGVLWPAATVAVSGATAYDVTGSVSGGTSSTPLEPGQVRAIRLRRYQIRNVNHYHIHGFRLRVEVAEVVGMDRNVFLYRRQPPDPYTGAVEDQLLGVASFPDMAEYPANAPVAEQKLPFFRKAFVEVDVRSTAEYDWVWRTLVSQVCSLRNALDKADVLEVAEDVWCGTPATTSEPSEASEPSEGSDTSDSSQSSQSV